MILTPSFVVLVLVDTIMEIDVVDLVDFGTEVGRIGMFVLGPAD